MLLPIKDHRAKLGAVDHDLLPDASKKSPLYSFIMAGTIDERFESFASADQY